MHIVLGGIGQVGSAAARLLPARDKQVTVVTRDDSHGLDLHAAGADAVTSRMSAT